MPSPTDSGRARKIPLSSVVMQVDQRDDDGSCGKEQRDSEQGEAE
jgi:hypothetical protein